MSSLKKHPFAPAPGFIALHDFEPNTALLYDHNAYAPVAEPEDKKSTLPSKQYFKPQRVHYVVIDKMNTSATSLPHPATQLSSATAVDNSCEKNSVHTADVWLLTHHDRALVKGGLRISLTTIESALIKKMLHHEERVVSKEELIRNIGREPDLYRGLEMCLSRLQDKFRRVNDGERLFRSVRNRGYCLTQKIKKPLEAAQPRR